MGNGAHLGPPSARERVYAQHAGRTERWTLNCTTLPDAAAAAGITHVDLLSLDVDGADYQALEGWLLAKCARPARTRRRRARGLAEAGPLASLHPPPRLSAAAALATLPLAPRWPPSLGSRTELTIDAILAEDSVKAGALLKRYGYRELPLSSFRNVFDRVYLRPGFRLAIEERGGKPRPTWCTRAWGPAAGPALTANGTGHNRTGAHR